MAYYYNAIHPESTIKMSGQLTSMLKNNGYFHRELIILCIGSDRSTGDSLGPIIGHKLQNNNIKNVYGTLSHPVHAANLSHTINAIYSSHSDPVVIAIDASLGTNEHIGYITLGTGPLIPGLGVKKKLPEVGDIHITGIVNSSDDMDCNLLQTTHLSIVVQIADIIVNVLCLSLLGSANFTNVYSYMQQVPDQLYQQLLTS